MVWGEEQNEEIFNFYQNLIRHRKLTRPWEIENENVV
jgi:hypothetical protein